MFEPALVFLLQPETICDINYDIGIESTRNLLIYGTTYYVENKRVGNGVICYRSPCKQGRMTV